MEKEINLREIIEVLFKGKWIILICMVILAVLVGLISMFIIPPKYESNAIVNVSNVNKEGQADTFNLESLYESILSDASINSLIEDLKLNSSKYSINSIRKNIQIQILSNGSGMKINAVGTDSNLTTNIVNYLAYEMAKKIEITGLSKDIVEQQNKLKEVKDSITKTNSELSEAENQLKLIPEKQQVDQVVTDSPLISSITVDSSSDIAKLKLQSEELNPAYTLLQSQVATISINLTKLRTEEQLITARLKEYSEKISEIEVQIQQEKLSLKSLDRLLDGSIAVFISPAIQTDEPINPNTVLLVIMGGLVGGVIGIISVFLRQYMRNA